jgi:hypothetical protein
MITAALAILYSCGMLFAAWHTWRIRCAHDALAQQYTEALALLVLAARAEPPIAVPEYRAACARLLDARGVTATVITSRADDTIH